MSALLEVEGLRAGYGGTEVLHGLSFRLPAGSFGVILGSNGAGKTTTLKALLGAAEVHAGRVTFDGSVTTAWPVIRMVQAGVAMSPEGRQLFPNLTVEENLRTGLLAARGRERRWELGEIYDIFPRLGERRRQHAGTMSGGEQQMLAIGRALASSPKLLLIDEASLGLSPAMVESVFELIARINQASVTVLAVEQNVAVVDHADYVFGLEKGELQFGGSKQDLSATLIDSVVSSYLGAGNK